MPIDLAAVGRSCGPNPVRWTQRDAIIYALGVGAGSQDPAEDLEFTTENSTGIVQKVLPTFPLVVHSGAPPIPIGDFDRRMSVHGEQSLILHRPLPPEGTGSTVSESASPSGVTTTSSSAMSSVSPARAQTSVLALATALSMSPTM